MNKVIKKLMLLVAIFVICIGMTTPQETFAKTKKTATVKSVTVTNVKNKKVSLYTGKTLKLKVKVNVSGKISKAVTYTTNNKKVATVTNKGVIKAVSKGTAKITVKSKANKKKKVVITVTVKNPVKITSVNVKNGDTVEFKLSEAYKLTSDKIVVYSKQTYYGSYVYKPTVVSIVTKDNINYTINLDAANQLQRNEYVRVIVKGLPGTGDATKEAALKYQNYTRHTYYYEMIQAGTRWLYELESVGTISVSGLPSGFKSSIEDNYVCIRAEEYYTKAGTYTFNITIKKPDGDTEVKQVSLVCYDSNKIYTTNRYIQTEITTNGYASIYSLDLAVAGGSGTYNYELVDSKLDENLHISLSIAGYIYGDVYKAGTYSVNVKITDANNPKLTAIEKVQIEVIDKYNISGTCNIKGIDYNSSAYFMFIGYGSKYTSNDTRIVNMSSTISTNLYAGKYHVVFYDGIGEYYSVGDINVTGNNDKLVLNVQKK